MLDSATYPLRALPAPALPIAQMVIGKSVEEAAELLPRLFNLCREAQGIAARAAFGVPLDPNWQAALQTEIQREHVVKLCLKWPGLLSRPSVPLPKDWQRNTDALKVAVFGSTGAVPCTRAEFEAWLRSGEGASPALRAIADLFAPGEAVRQALPKAKPLTLFQGVLMENSAASRRASHPVLQGVEAHWGRGPLWSAMGVLVDLEALLNDVIPQLYETSGRAIVPAARGLYGVSATVLNGKVAAFERVTPTDHLLAPGGALDQSLATLPAGKARALVPLLLSVLDPCFPVSLSDAKGPANA